MPHSRISELVLEGKHYLVIPKDVVQALAPQLLEPLHVEIEHDENTPWKVLERHLNDGISMAQAWREHLQLSQQEVADRLKVSVSVYSQYEKSVRPRRATLERIAKALGITVAQIL